MRSVSAQVLGIPCCASGHNPCHSSRYHTSPYYWHNTKANDGCTIICSQTTTKSLYAFLHHTFKTFSDPSRHVRVSPIIPSFSWKSIPKCITRLARGAWAFHVLFSFHTTLLFLFPSSFRPNGLFLQPCFAMMGRLFSTYMNSACYRSTRFFLQFPSLKTVLSYTPLPLPSQIYILAPKRGNWLLPLSPRQSSIHHRWDD